MFVGHALGDDARNSVGNPVGNVVGNVVGNALGKVAKGNYVGNCA